LLSAPAGQWGLSTAARSATGGSLLAPEVQATVVFAGTAEPDDG
jgi:hypothetical protein